MNYKINTLVFFQCFLSLFLFSQKNSCVREINEDWKRRLIEIQEGSTGERNQFVHKSIRVNFHFMLKTDGSGNFNEVGDNQGNTKSGYDITYELMEMMQNYLAWNRPTLNDANTYPNLPPVENRAYTFILDAVYFHRNDDYVLRYDITTSVFSNIGKDHTEVINVFFTDETGSSTISGYVKNQAVAHNTSNNYSEVDDIYSRYVNELSNPNSSYHQFLRSGAITIMHELGHLKGLLHTVYIGGTATPCNKLDSLCDDGISDTPTAYEVFHHANCGIHPVQGWDCSHPCCSKNLMDYEGGHALTPGQILVIHTGLEGGMRSYNLCTAVETNTTIHTLGFPKISYYGKKIEVVSATSGGTVTLTDNQPADMYFSEEIEFFPMEIEGTTNYRSKMEVFHYDTCNGF